MPDNWLLISDHKIKRAMRTFKREEAELGKAQIPANYGQPGFSVGDATNPGPNPDQQLSADQAAAMAAGDPNPGFSMGGAEDPMKEFSQGGDTSAPGLTKPGVINTPDFGMSSVQEDATTDVDGVTFDANGNVIGESGDFEEDDDEVVFDSVDEMPEFEEYDELDTADAAVDGAGVIDPEVIAQEDDDPEIGEMPDATLPMTEPIVQIDIDEEDVYATEQEIEGSEPEPIVVTESFRLPENRSVAVCKGDQIFVIGHAMNEKTPKFSESVFKRAFRSLVESKNTQGKLTFKKSEGMKKCALVGRSLLVEVAKDWRIPGTDLVLEAHDIIQIVSMKPIVEKTLEEGGEGSGNLDNFGDKKAPEFEKKECGDAVPPVLEASEQGETEEEKKAKQEAQIAYKRWLEAKARRVKESEEKKDSSDDSSKKDDDEGKASSEEDKKKKEAFLRKNGIYF